VSLAVLRKNTSPPVSLAARKAVSWLERPDEIRFTQPLVAALKVMLSLVHVEPDLAGSYS
jgi:hypothetical protein